MYSISLPPMEVSDTADGDIFDNGDHRLRVVSTPGHTKGSICLFDENSRDLYSGDTVFLSGVGRMDLPSGSYDDMRSSLDRISKLNIIGLFPGHGGTSREYGPDYVRRAARIVSI